jgi:hypothetical protein
MRWLLCLVILAVVAAFFVSANFHRDSGKLTLFANHVVRGLDKNSLPVVSPARFRFQTRQPAIFELGATNPALSFVVFTNDRQGNFVAGFEPSETTFSIAGPNTYNFWVRDARLLDYEWKVQVVRRVRYQLPRVFRFLASGVPGHSERWMSDAIKPSLSNWKFEPTAETSTSTVFRFPDHPTPTNEQPSFLTNGGSLFGVERELRYTR